MRKHLQWRARLSSANCLQLIRVFPLVNTADGIYVICRSLVQAHSWILPLDYFSTDSKQYSTG